MLPPLYIVRHGRTDWNAEERLQGQADTDINAEGRAQADRNGDRLAGLVDDPARFDFVASPLRRTCETMQRIRTRMGLPAEGYTTDPRLKEVHFGEWQGFTYLELEAREPGCTAARTRAKWHFLPPGQNAESYQILSERVASWIKDIQRPTICVTHGGVLRAVFHLIGKIPVDEAAEFHTPQDRILRVTEDRLEWI